MYKQTEWQDRVTEYEDRYKETENPDGTFTHTPVEGEIIQVGTPQNQTNFNNMEVGIQDAHIAAAILHWAEYQHNAEYNTRDEMTDVSNAERILAFSTYQHIKEAEAEIEGELHTVTLTNSQRQPFNSTIDTPKTVALTKNRTNLFYSVETEVTAHNGLVGEIQISDKALNGFKIAYTGSGKSVTLAIRVKGGMT